jgi:hypothetical protein
MVSTVDGVPSSPGTHTVGGDGSSGFADDYNDPIGGGHGEGEEIPESLSRAFASMIAPDVRMRSRATGKERSKRKQRNLILCLIRHGESMNNW